LRKGYLKGIKNIRIKIKGDFKRYVKGVEVERVLGNRKSERVTAGVPSPAVCGLGQHLLLRVPWAREMCFVAHILRNGLK